MAYCVEIQSGGTLAVVPDPADQCASFVMLDSVDYAQMVAMYPVDPADILYVYTWGFGAVLSTWAIAYVIRVAITIIRKL